MRFRTITIQPTMLKQRNTFSQYKLEASINFHTKH